MARITNPEHLAGELIQLGTVATVDHGAATCTVEIGDLTTGELPWLAPRAGGVKVWSPPSPGEQCAVLCPEGDLANGLVLLGLWSDANPAPSSLPGAVIVEMPDGAVIGYDPTGHALHVTLPHGGVASIDAPGGITLNGNVTINGTLSVSEQVEASGDVIASGISLSRHRHADVSAGAAQSGTPV